MGESTTQTIHQSPLLSIPPSVKIHAYAQSSSPSSDNPVHGLTTQYIYPVPGPSHSALSTIPPQSDNLHGKRHTRQCRLDAFGPLPSLHHLPDQFAIDRVALGLELHDLPLLAGTLHGCDGVVDAGARHKGEDGRVQQVRVAEAAWREHVGRKQGKRRDMAQVRRQPRRLLGQVHERCAGVGGRGEGEQRGEGCRAEGR